MDSNCCVKSALAALREGKKRGLVRSDVDPNERAIFLVAVYEGYLSLAKNSQDARMLRAGKRILILHLESLRPSAGQNRARLVSVAVIVVSTAVSVR